MSSTSAAENLLSPDVADDTESGDRDSGFSAHVRGVRPLRVCIVDMNDGHVNQAMRCLRGIVSRFFRHVQSYNPEMPCQLVEVSPRDTGHPIPRDADFYLSSGGPGSPYDGDGQPWSTEYGRFVESVVESNHKGGPDSQALFAICYSFEMVVRHFRLAELAPRSERKFGVMPVYMTPDGQRHPLLKTFGDRLFAFEHRNWEAVDLDQRALDALGGKLLAQESRDGVSKGRAILGLDVAPGVEAVQFHPEADRPGVMNWVARPDQAAAFKAVYGEDTYRAMLRTLDDPRRLARTYALLIPGWMVRRFNRLAPLRDYIELPPPSESVTGAFSSAEGLPAITEPPPRLSSDPPRIASEPPPPLADA
jgi:GMP synthase-like glutamine amidotransferase